MTVSARYDIDDMNPETHEFSVRLTLSAVGRDTLRLALPAWIPGSYMIRDFARNINDVRVFDEKGPVSVTKLDKQTWQTGHFVGDLRIDYRVYAFDLSVRSAFLDDKRAFFNGTSLLMRPLVDAADWQIHIPRPRHAAARDWRLWTTLAESRVDRDGFGTYVAQDYDELIDHPVECGAAVVGDFRVRDVPHRFVVSEGGTFDIDRICGDVSRICAEHAAMFGELPVRRYAFLTLATGDGYGGLEHRASTSLICKRADLPASSLGEPDKPYRQFLGLCSHEYFHLWNVKRIRPARFRDADLQTEVHTELLWAFEGITSYYDDLALPRSGVLSRDGYLDALASTVTRVTRGPGRHRQSIAESSFDAWTKFYKQDENAPNAIVSYYAKGALVAFGLDLILRLRSADRLSLDDLMRRLWTRFGRTGEGIPERGIEREVEGLLGESLQPFFDRYVYGTQDLPLDEWFGAFGVGYRLRAASAADDLGGHIARPATGPAVDPPKTPHLGARTAGATGLLRLTNVLADGPAQRAGLAPGDELVAIDGERVTANNWQDILRRAAVDSVQAHYFRRGRLYATELPIHEAPHDTCELWWLDEADLDSSVAARREAWLSSACAGMA